MTAQLSAADARGLILDRAHALALAEQPKGNVQQTKVWIASLPKSGWWPDISPQDRSRNSWQPHNQLTRLQSIAVLSGPGGPLAGDAAASSALVRGLRAWEHARPRSHNWWYNEIGVPLATVQILASRRDLPADLRQAMHSWLGKPLDEGEYQDTFTGQNLAWRARIALLAGIDAADPTAVTRAVQAIICTIAITDEEGLQVDGSWHQHGAQFMTGSYGHHWSIDMTRWLVILGGTPWALSPEQQDLIAHAVLDGLAWTLRAGHIDPAALGRTLSRERAHGRLDDLAVLARAVAALDGPRAQEWRQLATVAAGGHAVVASGSQHFWRSDASFIHRPGFSVGILAATTRTLRVESLNDEHLKGLLHADGATWIRQRGDEYARLTPGLPWGLLPGTVATPGTPLKPAGLTVPAESTFGAGIAHGHALVHGWDLRRADLRGHQAWFAVEQGVVALISDVNHPSREVRMSGPILPRQGSVTINDIELTDSAILRPGQSMVHNGLAWLAVEGEWEAYLPTLRGSWRSINAGGEASEIAVDSLRLRRVLRPPVNNGSGSWALLDLEDGQPPSPRFSVLANTPPIQAVQDSDGSVLAVFREAGEIGGLRSSGPAVILARPDGRLIAADPLTSRQPRRISIQWQGTTHEVAFPGGAHSAQPIIVRE